MKKSINAWSVEKDTGFEDMFAQVKAAGFDGIELNLDKEDSSKHSLTFSTSSQRLSEIKAISEKNELPVVSISCSLYGGFMGSPDENERAFASKILLRQLECAEVLGATGILVVPGGMTDKISLKTAWENSLKTLRGLKSDIEDKKIFVGVENVWNQFFTSPFDMCSFIDELGCEYIGAYFDVGNVVAYSVPEHWIEILGSRIGKIHVKDFKRNGGMNSGGEWADLLAGSINWQKVIPALAEAGFDGYLTAEVGKNNPNQTYREFYKMVSSQLEEIINI
ncbi:MAG: sugar phosphate isomerase/epimerase family protein [Eubacteriales bacterium]